MRREKYAKLTLEQKEAYRQAARERIQHRRATDPEFRARANATSLRYRNKNLDKARKKTRDYMAKYRDGRGKIYFVQAESGPIKIGFTRKKLIGRLKELQPGSFETLTLLGGFLGTLQEEQRLHQQFKAQEIRREWFRPTRALLTLIRHRCLPSLSITTS